MPKITKISGNIVDLIHSTIYAGTLELADTRIINIVPEDRSYENFIIPGLVDAHIHIESSMMVPSEFARLAVIHGTVAAVSDPHEIANVLGVTGIKYMIMNGKTVPFKFYFGAPSCVPATCYETAGAVVSPQQIEELFQTQQLKFLSEMMNFPGVIKDDPDVLAKIAIAQKYHRPIDGHAPGLKNPDLQKYIQAGISTDHETFELDEGIAKIKAGMTILIREGSAAKNFEALHFLIEDYSDQCMFCCDDKHPNELVKGHINEIVKRAIQQGYGIFKVLKCASLNPIKHYQLEVGLLQKGDPADFVVIDNFNDFNILKTYINGKVVAENGQSLIARFKPTIINIFKTKPKQATDFSVQGEPGKLKVIEAVDDELITRELLVEPKVIEGKVVSNPAQDILKITVVNRYKDTSPVVGFIKNFGLQRGAIASSVAHDSHNIIAVGVDDQEIAHAVNLIIKHKGGLVVVDGTEARILPLPVAGLMSIEDGFWVAQQYEEIAKMVKNLGSKLKDPFMTLSFMALLVIPDLKLSDQGLFNGRDFKFTSLFDR